LERKAKSIGEFLSALSVTIFCARGQLEDPKGSLARAIQSLEAAGVNTKLAPQQEVDVTDLIVVGEKRPARVVSPADQHLHVSVALRAYVEEEFDRPVLTTTARDFILAADWPHLSGTTRLLPLMRAAYEAARRNEDKEITAVLGAGLAERGGVRAL
jgi:hypothetical protein